MLDLVPNHTSDAHAWFVDALSGPGAAHREYYVWAAPSPDGGPPNNWLCATGAPAWTLDPESGQYYLHNFLPSQPDLNWWHEPVHEEFDDILRYWLDRGVAGFRIDVAHGLYKDALLRDNPPAGPTDHPVVQRKANCGPFTARTAPRSTRSTAAGARSPTATSRRRPCSARPGSSTTSASATITAARSPSCTWGSISALWRRASARPALAEVVENTLAALPTGAMPVWTASNHDVGRFPTRWCGDDARAVKAALTVLSTLPGTLVLYYGDELGHGRRGRARRPAPGRDDHGPAG